MKPKKDKYITRWQRAHKNGRPSAVEELTGCRETMRNAAPYAAAYLRDVVVRKKMRPSPVRVEAAKYIIDHELGKAPQKLLQPGDKGFTLQALLLLATQAGPELPEGVNPEVIAIDLTEEEQEKGSELLNPEPKEERE